jgi:hypothetical protein
MATAAKRTRKTLTLAEQKEQLAKDKAKLAAQEAKIAVLELKDYVKTLKVDSVQALFGAVKAHSKDSKDIEILQTIAEIVGLKVTITLKTPVTRAPKGSVKKPKAASK